MTPQEFIAKWKRANLSERSAAQQHFLDLCDLLGQPKPAQADPDGAWYTFERGVHKTGGGEGWADVWYKGHFAWEYKRKRRNLLHGYFDSKVNCSSFFRTLVSTLSCPASSESKDMIFRPKFVKQKQLTLQMYMCILSSNQENSNPFVRTQANAPTSSRTDRTAITREDPLPVQVIFR
jgi:hypothetical protein